MKKEKVDATRKRNHMIVTFMTTVIVGLFISIPLAEAQGRGRGPTNGREMHNLSRAVRVLTQEIRILSAEISELNDSRRDGDYIDRPRYNKTFYCALHYRFKTYTAYGSTRLEAQSKALQKCQKKGMSGCKRYGKMECEKAN
jgi:hypothetical protein